LPQLPALEKLLSRAVQNSNQSDILCFEATLCGLFGLATTNELPVAALTRPVDGADGAQAEPGHWLRADPVHLQADLYRLILQAAPPLDPDETAQLRTAFNNSFADSGLSLETPTPTRWYLRCSQAPALRTCPLSMALGQDIAQRLPQGPDAKHWHALLTECQMLLHQLPLNQARENHGLATVNSLWLWGGGTLPGQAPQAPYEDIYGNEILLRGLTRWRGAALNPLPANATEWLEIATGNSLIVLVLPSLQQQDGPESLVQLEHDWFAPLLRALQRKRIECLQLLPCDGRHFIVQRTRFPAFWRKTRPLAHWL